MLLLLFGCSNGAEPVVKRSASKATMVFHCSSLTELEVKWLTQMAEVFVLFFRTAAY